MPITITPQLRFLLALHHATATAPATGQMLLEIFSDLTELFATPMRPQQSQRLRDLGLTPALITALQQPNWQAIDAALAWAKHAHHYLITIRDQTYPPLLKEIARPPLALFISGNLASLQQPQLAIVGSRKPTPHGITTTLDFAAQLAMAGLSITSGLALGIDTAAHQGALHVGGTTIAVLGTGIDYIYPRRNHALAQQIISHNGAIISEFPLGTPPLALHFPQRNRIISGLSYGTLIIEAALQSGSLITARLALEQNREVFAVPGSIHNFNADGCNALIQQGAKLVSTIANILVDLPKITAIAQPISNSKQQNLPATTKQPQKNELDINCQKLLEYIDYEVTTMDTMAQRSGLTPQKVAALLVLLELQGYICPVPGGFLRTITKDTIIEN